MSIFKNKSMSHKLKHMRDTKQQLESSNHNFKIMDNTLQLIQRLDYSQLNQKKESYFGIIM